MRHGRAIIPFGKYKNVRVSLLPDDYLSYLTTLHWFCGEEKWRWLYDSVLAELKFRGYNIHGINTGRDATAVSDSQIAHVEYIDMEAHRKITLRDHNAIRE